MYAGEGDTVEASMDQLIDEAAARGGTVAVYVNDPNIWESTVDIVQLW